MTIKTRKTKKMTPQQKAAAKAEREEKKKREKEKEIDRKWAERGVVQGDLFADQNVTINGRTINMEKATGAGKKKGRTPARTEKTKSRKKK